MRLPTGGPGNRPMTPAELALDVALLGIIEKHPGITAQGAHRLLAGTGLLVSTGLTGWDIQGRLLGWAVPRTGEQPSLDCDPDAERFWPLGQGPTGESDPAGPCEQCGRPVPGSRRGPGGRYCSRSCRSAAYRDRHVTGLEPPRPPQKAVR